MIRHKCLLAAAFAFAFAPLATQAAETVYTFDSVTGIEHASTSTLIVRGILVNDTAPTSVSLPWGSGAAPFDRCEKLFNVVLAEPAAFTLTVTTDIELRYVGPPPETVTQVLVFKRCHADRKP